MSKHKTVPLVETHTGINQPVRLNKAFTSLEEEVNLHNQIKKYIESADHLIQSLSPSMDLFKLNAQFRALCFLYKMALELSLNFLLKRLNQNVGPSTYMEILPGITSLWSACRRMIGLTFVNEQNISIQIIQCGHFIDQIDTLCDTLGLENPTNNEELIQFNYLQARAEMSFLKRNMESIQLHFTTWENLIDAHIASGDLRLPKAASEGKHS